MYQSKFVNLKLVGKAASSGILIKQQLKLIDIDTGKELRCLDIALDFDDNLLVATIKVWLTEIDIESKFEKIVICRECKERQ